MARQTILLGAAIQSAQFWIMLLLGAIFFYSYFSYSDFLNRKVLYLQGNSIFYFLILRLSLGVWIPSALVLFLLKELFSFLGVDFLESGYMDTEYFILMIVLYSTTIAFIAICFYNRYHQTQKSLNILLSNTSYAAMDSDVSIVEDKPLEIELVNSGLYVELEKEDTFKRQLADMLLHVVLIRKRKNNTLLFRDDGTCEIFVSDPLVIDLYIKDNAILQINRWIWVNSFFIHCVKRENNEDYIILLEHLHEKFYNCKTFQEPHAQDQVGNKMNLFIGRSYKKSIKNRLKDNRGNINA